MKVVDLNRVETINQIVNNNDGRFKQQNRGRQLLKWGRSTEFRTGHKSEVQDLL